MVEKVLIEITDDGNTSHGICGTVKSHLTDGVWRVEIDSDEQGCGVHASSENRVAAIMIALCRRLGFAAHIEPLPEGVPIFNVKGDGGPSIRDGNWSK